MATLYSKPRHFNVKYLIEYVLNPKKTDNLKHVSSINCNPTFAHEQFDIVQRNYHYINGNKSKNKRKGSSNATEKRNIVAHHVY